MIDEQGKVILCDMCVMTFGKPYALSATMVLHKDSILLKGKVLSRHVCDEHGEELYEKEWRESISC